METSGVFVLGGDMLMAEEDTNAVIKRTLESEDEEVDWQVKLTVSTSSWEAEAQHNISVEAELSAMTKGTPPRLFPVPGVPAMARIEAYHVPARRDRCSHSYGGGMCHTCRADEARVRTTPVASAEMGLTQSCTFPGLRMTIIDPRGDIKVIVNITHFRYWSSSSSNSSRPTSLASSLQVSC